MAFVWITEFESGYESESALERELNKSYKQVQKAVVNLGKKKLALVKKRLVSKLSWPRYNRNEEEKLAQDRVVLMKENMMFAKKAKGLMESFPSLSFWVPYPNIFFSS